jgi:hypothetical protein
LVVKLLMIPNLKLGWLGQGRAEDCAVPPEEEEEEESVQEESNGAATPRAAAYPA